MKFALPLLASATLVLGDSNLAFRAVEGTTIERSISQKTTWTLESLTEVSPAGRVDEPQAKATGGVELELAVTDEIKKAADGHALRLERVFDTVQSTASLELSAGEDEIAVQIPSKSPLEKKKVVFQRKKADDAFEAALDTEKGGLDEVLEHLTEDLDLRALLPKDAVKVGGSWEPPASALASILAPGGALAFEPDTSVLKNLPPPQVLVPYQAMLATLVGPSDNAEKIEGDFECTWKETSKKDGHELARIEFEIDVTTKTDFGKEIVRRLEAAGMPTEGAPDSARGEGKLSGKGHFTWDVTAGRASELQATLEWHLVMIARWKAGSDEVGVDVAIEGTTELKNTYAER